MADQIKAQYPDLKKIQDELLNEASIIGQVRANVAEHVDTLRQGMWVGDAANAFFGEMDCKVYPGIDNLKKALETFSQYLGQIQNAIAQAEQNACSRFSSKM